MPCREWFDEQPDDYRDAVIPPTVRARVSVEAGVAQCWRDVVGDAGRTVSIEHYGASAAGAKLFEEFGFSAATVAEAARESIAATGETTSVPVRRAPSGPVGPADVSSAHT